MSSQLTIGDMKKRLLSKSRYDIDDLVDLVVVLRSEEGCPWDKVQTHETIRKDFIEETYEVIEAIDCKDPIMLREELGDVLLQVVFHTVIEQEKECFDLEGVITELVRKLIIRHPHVFGDVEADTVDKVLYNWDEIKKEEKGQETVTDTLRSVPKTFPAMMRAQKLAKRAAKARPAERSPRDVLNAWNDVKSCNEELRGKLDLTGFDTEERDRVYLGELMFSVCELARQMGYDAEEVLTEANERFIRRFEDAERSGELDFEKRDRLWRKKS